ncbi:MAG TPA: hypothetical protein VJ947_00270 [Pseudohaliea sp.]|nr:hypothetical protein [Pseudohaliea sp.]
MNDRDDQRNDQPDDQESILLALDQISQTIDVMTSVVGRLRSQVEARGESSSPGQEALPPESATDRILH